MVDVEPVRLKKKKKNSTLLHWLLELVRHRR